MATYTNAIGITGTDGLVIVLHSNSQRTHIASISIKLNKRFVGMVIVPHGAILFKTNVGL